MFKLILLFFLTTPVFGQVDSITLQEVILVDPFLKNHNISQSKIVLGDSIINKNNSLLSQVIQNETTINIKENGLGMVSSPAFRGTTASQTALIWNGININSSINGQIDFNITNAKSFDNLIVQPGGGSIAYGTSAIGGSIHLTNALRFNNTISHQLNTGYGSFNTYQGNYKLNFSTNKLSINTGYARLQSNNDYKIDNYLKYNRNGKYYLNSIDFNLGYRFAKHQINIFSLFNFGDRHFSLTDIYQTPTKYSNQDNRIAGQWIYDNKKIKSDFKIAFLQEANQYFANIDNKKSQDLSVNNWVAKYYLDYKLGEKKSLSFFTENIYSSGDGDNIKKANRNTFALGLIYKQSLINKIIYEISTRQDFSTAYDVPFLYSIGFKYFPYKFYTLRFNYSKNFRTPTFNDLYWQTAGNPNLKAEKATQIEIGNDFNWKSISLQTNVFYNDIKDMIQWIPSENNSSIWKPINNNQVKTYGFELIGLYSWNKFSFKSTYSYTKSINQLTNKSLIYVPKHLLNFNISYQLDKLSLYLQNRFVDKVYTQTDLQQSIPNYWLTNFGINYNWSKNMETSFTLNNIFNKPYQSVYNRWMPGTNFFLNLNIKL